MLRFLTRTVLIMLFLLLLAIMAFRIAAALRESVTPVSLAPESGQFISTASGMIYTQMAGPADGIPVLLAHGTAAWSGFWQAEVDLLGAQGPYRAIAFDMPPFGFSDRANDGDYSRAAQAQRILDLVTTLDAPPIMVAHSFGAAAATEAVLKRPGAFAGLIIIDGALGMETNPAAKSLPLVLRPTWVREMAIAATATNPWATRFLLRGMLHKKDAAKPHYIHTLKIPQRRIGTTAAYADWVPALLAPAANSLSRNPASYADLPLPVRIIWGDKDTVTPPEQAEALAAALGQADVAYLAGVGHIPHIEAPDAFSALLLKTLAEIRQPR